MVGVPNNPGTPHVPVITITLGSLTKQLVFHLSDHTHMLTHTQWFTVQTELPNKTLSQFLSWSPWGPPIHHNGRANLDSNLTINISISNTSSRANLEVPDFSWATYSRMHYRAWTPPGEDCPTKVTTQFHNSLLARVKDRLQSTDKIEKYSSYLVAFPVTLVTFLGGFFGKNFLRVKKCSWI